MKNKGNKNIRGVLEPALVCGYQELTIMVETHNHFYIRVITTAMEVNIIFHHYQFYFCP